MFPLTAGGFPDEAPQLHAFVERYRVLVRELLEVPEAERVFGVTAIREGYEVGEHGSSSLHTTGTLVRLTNVEPYDDGRFDITVLGLTPMRLHSMLPYRVGLPPRGEIEELPDPPGLNENNLVGRMHETFYRYRDAMSGLGMQLAPRLPADPRRLSWVLARRCFFNLADQQSLLDAPTPRERLNLVAFMLGQEIRAMTALPSLPATDIARTRWSPN